MNSIIDTEGHCLRFASDYGSMALVEKLPEGRAAFSEHGQKAWDILIDIEQREGAVTNESLIKGLYSQESLRPILIAVSAGVSTHDTVMPSILAVRECHKQRVVCEVGRKLQSGDMEPGRAITILEESSTPKGREILVSRRFSIHNPPKKAEPRLYLAGQGLATPGNITVITGQAKAGKSAFIGGVIASIIDGREHLGITAPANTEGHGWVHNDTEQSPYDHWQGQCKILRRAGVDDAPSWLRSYSLKGLSTAKKLELLELEMAATKADCGKVRGVLIDGVADLCRNINDIDESNDLVEKLEHLAVKYDCPIIVILHLNQGSKDTNNKARGHLGSQLERKAESVIHVDKDSNGVVTVWDSLPRNGYLPKEQGIQFAWDDDEGMFMQLVATRNEARAKGKADEKRSKLIELATSVVSRNGARSYGDFIKDLTPLCPTRDHPNGSPDKAKHSLLAMTALAPTGAILVQNLLGQYELNAKGVNP